MTRTERVELIFEQRTPRFLRSVRISSAVWQARAAPGVAPVGRRSLAHLSLSPRRALLALQPHAFGALGHVPGPAAAPDGRLGGPAIRPWTHRLGTLDIEWQCKGVLPVRSPSSGSVGGTATRA